MKYASYKFIFLILILSSFLFLFSCSKNEAEKENDKTIQDEYGYLRPKEGIYSESLVLNSINYNKYKNNLIGDGGESGLINKEIVSLNEKKILKDEYNYFIYVFYGNGSLNISTYFKTSILNKNRIVFDNDACNFSELVCYNYKINDRKTNNCKLSFDIEKNPNERFSFECGSEEASFFSLALPFKINEYGSLDISFLLYDDELSYKYQKDYNILVSDEKDFSPLININNYSISFISESLCSNGSIDNDKLTNEPNFIKGFSKFMIIDFDLDVLEDNDGTNKFYIAVYAKNLDDFEIKVEDASTSNIIEEKIDKLKIIKAGISILRNKINNRKYRVIFKCKNNCNYNTDINVFLYSDKAKMEDCKNNLFIARPYYGLKFYEDNQEYYIKAIDKSIYEMTVPSTYNNKKVYIGINAFENCKDLKELIIDDGVEVIEIGSFKDCSNLERIKLPDSITYVGSNAFLGCPESLFYNSRDGLYLGNEFNPYLIFISPINKDIINFELNANTKVIGYGAFSDCINLSTINLMNVEYISNLAFENCTSLTEINIPKTVKKMYVMIFNGCTNVEKLTIPFVGNSRRESIDEKKSNYQISKFFKVNGEIPTSLKKITITDEKYILSDAFIDCDNVTEIEIGNSLLQIEEGALKYCTKLEKLTIPFIGEKRYKDKSDETHTFGYIFANSYSASTSISEYEENLKYSIPETLKYVSIKDIDYIPEGAFNGCNNILQIEISENITKVDSYAFWGCDSLVGNEYNNALYLGNNVNPYLVLLKAKSVDIESCLINEKCKIILDYAFAECKKIEEILIPNNVLHIGNCAFRYCEKLKSITLSNNMTTLEQRVLGECSSLEEIDIPSNITSINTFVFSGCDLLKKVLIHNSSTNIYRNTFLYCKSMEFNEYKDGYYLGDDTNPFMILYKLKNENAGSLEINGNCELLINDLFNDNEYLSIIIIPKEIKRINARAFNKMKSSNSLDIYYKGSLEEWNNIIIDNSTYWPDFATIHFDYNDDLIPFKI